MNQEKCNAVNKPFWGLLAVAKQLSSENKPVEQYAKQENKINIETRRSTTLKQHVILVQGPCWVQAKRSCVEKIKQGERCMHVSMTSRDHSTYFSSSLIFSVLFRFFFSHASPMEAINLLRLQMA